MENTAHFYPLIFLHKILQVYIKALLHIHMKNAALYYKGCVSRQIQQEAKLSDVLSQ